MMPIQDIHSLLVIAVILLLGSGFGVLAWGRKLPRQGDWCIWSAFAIALAAAGHKAANLLNEGVRLHTWARGWISASPELGAITVGVLEDPLALAMTATAMVLGSVLLLNRGLLAREPRLERIYAAVAFSCGGITLSSIALTPWLALMGFAATALGGFVALGSRWNDDTEASLASAYALQRTWGILLTLLGAAGLAVSRGGLNWAETTVWFSGAALSGVDQVGAALFLLGIYVQLQPFPLLGWLVRPALAPTFHRALLTQLFPALAATIALVRLQPQFQHTGLLEVFGWMQLASAALAIGCGFAQSQWRLGFGTWLSAASSIATAMIAFGYPVPGISLMVGALLGGSAIGAAASNIGAGNPKEVTDTAIARGTWTRIVALFGMCAATGMLGFVSAGGMLHWIAGSWNQSANAAVYVIMFFCFAMLGWKLAWQLFRVKNPVQFSWTSVLSPLLLVFLALGWIWTGTVSGGVLPPGVDQVLPSLASLFIEARQALPTDEAAFTGASVAYWACLFLAMGLGYWLAERSLQRQSGESSPFVRFVANGYGIDQLSKSFLNGMVWFGTEVVDLLDRRVWKLWVPAGLVALIRHLAKGAMALDAALFTGLRTSLRKGVDAPARALQLIQNGDVQWYIFFAIGSGIVMLIHFMRN